MSAEDWWGLLGVAVVFAMLALLAYAAVQAARPTHPHRVSRREYRRELEAQARAQEARTDAASHRALEEAWATAFANVGLRGCSHLDAVDVHTVAGELVARWCPTCERQLDLDEAHGPALGSCSCPAGMDHQHGCPHRRNVHGSPDFAEIEVLAALARLSALARRRMVTRAEMDEAERLIDRVFQLRGKDAVPALHRVLRDSDVAADLLHGTHDLGPS